VNETGEVAGSSSSSTGLHAFLWSGGAMRDLGTLPGIPGSTAFGLNGFGQVVGAGRAGTGYKRSVRAFVYTSGTMLDLTNLIVSNPGWVVIEARAINDAGAIVGIGRFNAGAQHAVLLTPI
jgi:probable HAF family extracellular repeat protein